MSTSEIVEAVLRLIELLTRWPLIVLYVTVIFRKPIVDVVPELLTALTSRITKISAPGFEMELSEARELANPFEPELRQEILERAPLVLVDEMDDSDQEEPLTEENVDEDDQTQQSEIDELLGSFEDIANT